jgi:hypothetical protein
MLATMGGGAVQPLTRLSTRSHGDACSGREGGSALAGTPSSTRRVWSPSSIAAVGFRPPRAASALTVLTSGGSTPSVREQTDFNENVAWSACTNFFNDLEPRQAIRAGQRPGGRGHPTRAGRAAGSPRHIEYREVLISRRALNPVMSGADAEQPALA